MKLRKALTDAGIECVEYSGSLYFLLCSESRAILRGFDVVCEVYPGGSVCVRDYAVACV